MPGPAAFEPTGPRDPLTTVGSGRPGSTASPRATRIGSYELLEELARGGMGVVYRARHLQLGREVALKVLIAGGAASSRQRTRFQLEAQATARLRHPHVVTVHDVGEDQGRPYLVMDLVAGESLQERLDRGGPLPPLEAATLVLKLASALEAAHEHMILHRDLKPANVLLDPQGEPLLTDFGLAKLVERAQGSGPTQAGQLLGTPGFMSPEQGNGAPTDWRTDVYGLGATLYAALAGRPPYAGNSLIEVLAAMASKDPLRPSRVLPAGSGVPRDLETICLKCLERAPESRYPTARALRVDLEHFVRDEPIEARRPSPVERAGRWLRRHRRLVGSVVVGVGLILIVGSMTALGSRTSLRREAERSSAAAWQGLEDVAPDADAEARLGLALEALYAAQHWRSLGGGEASAAAEHRAALGLGDVALEGAQWTLARKAYQLAEGSSVDSGEATQRAANVEAVQQAEAGRRRDEVLETLDAAESGELAERSEGRLDAVFTIVRYAEAQTVELLAERLVAIAGDLLAVERAFYLEAAAPDATETSAGARPIVGLEQALDERAATPLGELLGDEAERTLASAVERLEARARRWGGRAQIHALVGDRQRDALGQGRLDVAWVACHSLGRIGIRERAVEALGRYLDAEADARRAEAAALALCRLGGERALAFVHAARRRFDVNTAFGRAVNQALGVAGGEVALEGESARGFQRRGEALQTQGDLAGAMADYERALEIDPDLVAALLNRGKIHMEQGRLDAALRDFDRCLRLDPSEAVAWNNRGLTRYLGRELKLALADLDRALELAPGLASAWSNRAVVRKHLGDLPGAVADYGRSLELDPSLADAWFNRGVARWALRDTEGALADMAQAIEVDPSSPRGWAGRGFFRLEAGHTEQALLDLERALELAPDDTRTRFFRARARHAVGDLTGALADLDRVLRESPGLGGELYYLRGLVKQGLGDLPGALREFDEAGRRRHGPSVFLSRAEVLLELGDGVRARSDLETFLRVAPATHPRRGVGEDLLRQLGE